MNARERKIQEIQEIVTIRVERLEDSSHEELLKRIERLETKVLDQKQAAMISAILEMEKDL